MRPTPLRIASIRSTEFVDPWPEPYRDAHVETSMELFEEYGMPGDLGVLDEWQGYSEVRMADLSGHLFRGASEVAMIAIAYATPDLMLPDVLGCYLVDALGGNPELFGVSDQGGGAGFSALVIAAAMTEPDQRGLLFAVDQQSPYHPPNAPGRPETNAFVVVELAPDGDLELVGSGVRSTTDPVRTLRESVPDATVVYVGATLAELDSGRVDLGCVEQFVGPPGTCTSAWRALEAEWPTEGLVVLADYDRYAERLYFCTFDAGPAVVESVG